MSDYLTTWPSCWAYKKNHVIHEGKDTSLLDYLLDLQKKHDLEQSKIRAKQRTKNIHDTGDDVLGG